MTNERGAVELRGVTKRFGTVVAVNALDLSVQPGEFLSLLGPSGCGKTTTLRMLAGFEHPDEGVILLAGVDIAGTPPYRRDVNTVFQHYALFPHMTVAENVAYGLWQKKVSKGDVRRRVAEALDMVEMTALAGRKPKQLSGGQQQRVALARALVNKPALLLLDEPLGALDRKLRQEMQIELKLLQTQVGITFIYVTHDQEEALSMSDRIAVMLHGRVQQLGTPDDVYDRPATAFVAGFIGQQNFLTGTARCNGTKVVADEYTLVATRRADDVVVGADALAAVRPEHVVVAASDPGCDTNVVRGTLAGVSHLGEVMQYVVRAGGRHDLISRRSRHLAERLAVGDEVWCTWSPEHVHVFGAAQAPLVLGDDADGARPSTRS